MVSINEIRSERGLPPAPWGDAPWLPLQWERTDMPRQDEMPRTGRNRPPEQDTPIDDVNT